MTHAVNSPWEPGEPPVEGNKPWAALYFCLSIAVLQFLCFNLCISTLITRFRALKAEYNGSALLTHKQVQQQTLDRLLRIVRLEVSQHDTSRHITSRHITWYHMTSHDITDISCHHNTSHGITTHHMTPMTMTSHVIT